MDDSQKNINLGFALLRTTSHIQPFFSYHVPIWFSIFCYYLYQFQNLYKLY
jgi:hypothetical protein